MLLNSRYSSAILLLHSGILTICNFPLSANDNTDTTEHVKDWWYLLIDWNEPKYEIQVHVWYHDKFVRITMNRRNFSLFCKSLLLLLFLFKLNFKVLVLWYMILYMLLVLFKVSFERTIMIIIWISLALWVFILFSSTVIFSNIDIDFNFFPFFLI